MRIYIGQNNEITTHFSTGVESTQAVIVLTNEYYITTKSTVQFNGRISIGVWYSNQAREDGKSSMFCTELNNATFIDVDISDVEFGTELSGSIADFLFNKVVAKLEELVPTWSGKLIVQ